MLFVELLLAAAVLGLRQCRRCLQRQHVMLLVPQCAPRPKQPPGGSRTRRMPPRGTRQARPPTSTCVSSWTMLASAASLSVAANADGHTLRKACVGWVGSSRSSGGGACVACGVALGGHARGKWQAREWRAGCMWHEMARLALLSSGSLPRPCWLPPAHLHGPVGGRVKVAAGAIGHDAGRGAGGAAAVGHHVEVHVRRLPQAGCTQGRSQRRRLGNAAACLPRWLARQGRPPQRARTLQLPGGSGPTSRVRCRRPGCHPPVINSIR
jgi:hypothetical protein